MVAMERSRTLESAAEELYIEDVLRELCCIILIGKHSHLKIRNRISGS